MRLLNWLLLPLLCLFGTAHAFSREAPATQEEKDTVSGNYIACQVDNAIKLDDGVSDASTIGEVIAAKCRPEMEELARVLTKDQKRDRVRLMVIERMGSRAAQEATEAVLVVRREKKKAGFSDK